MGVRVSKMVRMRVSMCVVMCVVVVVMRMRMRMPVSILVLVLMVVVVVMLMPMTIPAPRLRIPRQLILNRRGTRPNPRRHKNPPTTATSTPPTILIRLRSVYGRGRHALAGVLMPVGLEARARAAVPLGVQRVVVGRGVVGGVEEFGV